MNLPNDTILLIPIKFSSLAPANTIMPKTYMENFRGLVEGIYNCQEQITEGAIIRFEKDSKYTFCLFIECLEKNKFDKKVRLNKQRLFATLNNFSGVFEAQNIDPKFAIPVKMLTEIGEEFEYFETEINQLNDIKVVFLQ